MDPKQKTSSHPMSTDPETLKNMRESYEVDKDFIEKHPEDFGMESNMPSGSSDKPSNNTGSTGRQGS